uniref:(+)-neomenthol dehydrogenase-like n=1 Tax=Kalanchoe fedtschenkoi TaxID=63787 RepID=A0A7N0TR38_KALFE
MAEKSPSSTARRYALVTGANKGIGYEICRLLASQQVVVVLTARNEKRGLVAADKLKASGLSDYIVFHQLDLKDPSSVASLAEFIRSQFGKLDILVNNAGVLGANIHPDVFDILYFSRVSDGVNLDEIMLQPYDLAEECQQINYYGARRVIEAHLPLLESSDCPTIVNVSSIAGLLKDIPGKTIRTTLNDIDNLTDQKVEELLDEFLRDFKTGDFEPRGWPRNLAAYTMLKAALNTCTRLLAKKYPKLCINSVCPGYCRTDITHNTGPFSVEDGARNVVKFALLPDGSGGPSGRFFRGEEMSF